MCSLLSSGQDAVFLDLGAGTPIKRSAYSALGQKNHISSALSSLPTSATLLAVISHPDSDHWRLLDWDSSLAGAINSIVMPSNVPSLALKSHRLTKRVFSSGDFALQLGAGGDYLRVYRSAPSHSDRNGECLVCEVEIGGRTALVAGDYVYHRMATDAHPRVQALCAKSYDAVVVPHHGDKASARAVPSGAHPGKSLAFFSAGDHRRYGHPHPRSQGAHISRGYCAVLDKHRTDIRGVRLLP